MKSPKRIAAIVVYGAASAAAAVLAAIGLAIPWAFERELFLVRASGWGALVLLASALCATPAGRVLGRLREGTGPYVSATRRALGVAAAALATLHGALSLSTYLADAPARALELAWIRGGMLAWAVLAALWITSYPRLVRALRVRAWKPLHRLAYAAALFAAQHTLLAPLAPRSWVLGVFGAVLAIGLLRLVPERQRSSTPSQARSQSQS